MEISARPSQQRSKSLVEHPADLREFYQPRVGRGKTVWPRTAADLLRYGVRWDYDGIIQLDDGKGYHKYQLQPNAGNIPSTVKRWRDANGGTHAVIGTIYMEEGKEAEEDDFVTATNELLNKL